MKTSKRLKDKQHSLNAALFTASRLSSRQNCSSNNHHHHHPPSASSFQITTVKRFRYFTSTSRRWYSRCPSHVNLSVQQYALAKAQREAMHMDCPPLKGHRPWSVLLGTRTLLLPRSPHFPGILVTWADYQDRPPDDFEGNFYLKQFLPFTLILEPNPHVKRYLHYIGINQCLLWDLNECPNLKSSVLYLKNAKRSYKLNQKHTGTGVPTCAHTQSLGQGQ